MTLTASYLIPFLFVPTISQTLQQSRLPAEHWQHGLFWAGLGSPRHTKLRHCPQKQYYSQRYQSGEAPPIMIANTLTIVPNPAIQILPKTVKIRLVDSLNEIKFTTKTRIILLNFELLCAEIKYFFFANLYQIFKITVYPVLNSRKNGERTG